MQSPSFISANRLKQRGEKNQGHFLNPAAQKWPHHFCTHFTGENYSHDSIQMQGELGNVVPGSATSQRLYAMEREHKCCWGCGHLCHRFSLRKEHCRRNMKDNKNPTCEELWDRGSSQPQDIKSFLCSEVGKKKLK